MKKNLFVWLLYFALSTSLFAGIPGDLSKPFLIEEPDNPIESFSFSLVNPAGKPVSLKDFEGQILLINFWATWCIPCIIELPDFEELLSELEKEKFSILAINVMDKKNRVDRFIEKKNLTLPVVMDLDGVVYPKYMVQNFPTTVIIDKRGREIGRAVGIRPWASPESVRFFRDLSKRPEW